MRRRELIEAIQNGVLPSGYTALEYLESTGTQSISLGISASRVSYFEFDGMRIVRSGVSSMAVCGGRNQTLRGGNNNIVFFNDTNIEYQYAQSYFQITSIVGTTRRIYQFHNASVLADDVAYFPSTISQHFHIFGANNAGSMLYGSNRIYRFSCDTGTDIYNLLPALDDNNVPCMYDTVNGQTYYNAGTGDFLYA